MKEEEEEPGPSKTFSVLVGGQNRLGLLIETNSLCSLPEEFAAGKTDLLSHPAMNGRRETRKRENNSLNEWFIAA